MIFTPSKNNPIIKPNPRHSWEALKVYNCGAIYDKNKYYLFYRAVNGGKKWQSVIGLATSDDGLKFRRYKKPVMSADTRKEKRGLEDPRITKIDDTFFMAYAAYDGITPRLNIATSKNLINWKKGGAALKDFKFEKYGGCFIKFKNGKKNIIKMPYEWSKSGGIFPEKINGKYWMIFGEFKMWLASSIDGLKWKVDKKPFLNERENFFDEAYVEMGPPPIKTNKGWLVLYHGINNQATYQLGYLLLDLKNPKKIIYRSKKSIFSPKEANKYLGIVDIDPEYITAVSEMNKTEQKRYIKSSKLPKVIFCNGAVLIKDTLRIYYGINDTYIGTATAKLKDILNSK